MTKPHDGLILKPPHPQIAFDLFAGEWAYDIPIDETQTGAGDSFRYKHHSVWMAEEAFGSLTGMKCLELGPNEGEVAFHMHHAGCREIRSIEARVRSYLKCLIVKNFLRMDSVQFFLGDFVQYLEHTPEHYDFCMAAGVLYHMTNPLRLIELMAKKADRVAIATHYFTAGMLKYDPKMDTTGLPTASWDIENAEGEDLQHGGMTARVFKYSYRTYLDTHATFGHGGPAPFAYLMQQDDIIRALKHFGMKIVGEIFDDPGNPRGAHLHLIAQRA